MRRDDVDADLIVIGGGFFGLRIAQFARERLGAQRVMVLERENETMNRASYVNQARVHNGYHYPRSILTAYRSRVSSAAWSEEFSASVFDDFTHYYAVASRLSKVTARQFEVFCDRIGASLSVPAPSDLPGSFSTELIEKVWKADEFAFDARKLRTHMLNVIERVGGIDVRTGQGAARVLDTAEGPAVETDSGDLLRAPLVVSSVYANMNELHRASGLPLIPLQYEIAEMALVRLPPEFSSSAITVMDGPFFSIMPFPSRGLHTLSHVRYTPQLRWWDSAAAPDPRPIPRPEALASGRSTFREMKADVRRYVPGLDKMEYVDSIREVKVVLADSDRTDSRPILVRPDHGLPGYVCVMGGKIDNVNDVLEALSAYVHERLGRQGTEN